MASTLVLVRLLAPEDFGLIALAGSFTLAVEALALIDVEDAVARDPAPVRAVYDTAFTLGLLRGLAIGAMIAALAAPAARFFSEPRLEAVILALGLGYQWAAMPSSAMRCISSVRICTSNWWPPTPITVVCSD